MNPDIRKLFPVTQNYVYLNHAAVCPISTPVYERMDEYTRDVLANGRTRLVACAGGGAGPLWEAESAALAIPPGQRRKRMIRSEQIVELGLSHAHEQQRSLDRAAGRFGEEGLARALDLFRGRKHQHLPRPGDAEGHRRRPPHDPGIGGDHPSAGGD